MNRRRVVITGLGVISPSGNDVETFWESLKQGKSSIGPITKFDTSDFDVKIAGEVKNFDIKKYGFPFMLTRQLDEFIQEMNSSANVCTKIIFKKPRIIRYGIEVKNIGYWESERVFIPEKNVIITQLKEPMGPFKYLVVIYVLEKDNQGTKFTYIEEFDVCDNYQNEVEKIYSDISKKVNPILQKITDYFNLEHILQ